MDIQKIQQYKSAFNLIAKSIKDDEGNTIEIWYARELQQVLGYSRWENFVVAIGRVMESCKYWESMWMIIFVRSRKWSLGHNDCHWQAKLVATQRAFSK